jgi:hypothetical protein
MKGLKSALGPGPVAKRIILLSMKSTDYRAGQEELLNVGIKSSKKLCYVTVNDPYESIEGKLGGSDGSRLFFIDCVSSTVKTPASKDNVIFVSSPRALTEVSIAVKKAIESAKPDLMIFDSLSAMLIYEKSLGIMKFVHSLILTLRSAGLGTVFIILKEDVSEDLMKDLAMFVDKIVDV